MTTRLLLLLGAAVAIIFLSPLDTASAGGCGTVQYGESGAGLPAVPATDEPGPTLLEPRPADPRCKRANATGSAATGGLAAAGAIGLGVARYRSGGRPAAAPPTSSPAAPPTSSPAAPPARAPTTLHHGNATSAQFRQMFSPLLGRNLMYWYPRPEWQNNCQACSVTAELIFRRADVMAIPRHGFGTPADIFRDSYTGQWRDRILTALGLHWSQPQHPNWSGWQLTSGYPEIAGTMHAAGDGARAIVYGSMWHSGMSAPVAHVFNVVNNGGVVCFVDLQTGAWAHPAPYTYFEILRTN